MAPPPVPEGKVDRQKTVPFHLKLFYRTGGFHRPEEFHPSASPLPPHLQIYTWPTCTLRELSHLMTSALPTLLPDPAIGTRLSYRLIFADTRDVGRGGPGRYVSKELGSVVLGGDGGGGGAGSRLDDEVSGIVAGGRMAGELGGEPSKTLQDARFVIGDYISCAVLPPLPNGSVAPPPAPGGGRLGGTGGGGGARGDFGGGRALSGSAGVPRENGFGSGFRVRGNGRGADFGSRGGGMGVSVPSGEWRRGERVPEGPSGGRAGSGSYGRGRGRGGY
ncbi:MAG: hypothetical protein M1825_005761 [Sarcosagium campestre]|nr:MAG: hypothetical protein M1825_005761 [Sarcosagium campestre]